MVQNEKGLLDTLPQLSMGRKQIEKATQLQTWAIFIWKRKDDLGQGIRIPKSRSHENNFQEL